jgi:hypothetical protein
MDNIERLIMDLKESLEREIRETKAELIARFDAQAARLDRQGALLQVGNRWTARLNEWSEKMDAAMEARVREIAELRARIAKLEQR